MNTQVKEMNPSSKNIRTSLSLVAGLILLLGASLVHLTQGQADITATQLVTDIWKEGTVRDVVLSLRMPRLVIGLLVGGALAVSGVILQTLTNNPLASASTLGINSGAFFFVVCFMIFFPGLLGKFPFIVALSGAIVSTLLVLALAGKAMEPVRVALTGMIVSLLFASVTGALQLLFENETNGLFLWGSGSLVQLNWNGTLFAFPVIALVLTLALFAGRALDTLSLGDELAISLGLNIGRLKLFAWGLAITMAAVTVSIVGPIGFIGLMAPHIVRLMGISGHRMKMVHSFLWGSVILILADILSRWIQPATEMPVGAMTAMVGGPWLMILAYRTAKRQQRGEKPLGGTKKPVRLQWLIPVLLVLIGIFVYVSFSYNGMAWADMKNWVSPAIWQFRIPRVLTAFIAGVILAVGGVILQGVLRNPLADASVLGITSLGGAGAMTFLALIPGLSAVWMPVGAIVGAATALMILLFASWRNQFQPILVALMGISISAFGSALIQILVVKLKVTVAAALVWLSGSTYAKGWGDVQLILIASMLLLPLAVYLTRSLDTLTFGDDVAASQGLHVSGTRVFALILTVALSSLAISVVGTIGFIGLLAPHAARRIVGFRHLPLLVTSALLGGLLLVAADFIGRVSLAPKEIPSGLVVALIGAPYLLYLLKQTK